MSSSLFKHDSESLARYRNSSRFSWLIFGVVWQTKSSLLCVLWDIFSHFISLLISWTLAKYDFFSRLDATPSSVFMRKIFQSINYIVFEALSFYWYSLPLDSLCFFHCQYLITFGDGNPLCGMGKMSMNPKLWDNFAPLISFLFHHQPAKIFPPRPICIIQWWEQAAAHFYLRQWSDDFQRWAATCRDT